MLGFLRKKAQKLPEVVDITNPTRQSILGKYFIGQTEKLLFGDHGNAWGGLINPQKSSVDMYFDIFTIANFSPLSFLAEIWLSPTLPGEAVTSTLVHPSNLTISPAPKPVIKLKFADQVNGFPTGGMNVFDRIVPPNSTLVSDPSKGSIILPPGGSFVVFLKPSGLAKYQSRIALTWWEEPI